MKFKCDTLIDSMKMSSSVACYGKILSISGGFIEVAHHGCIVGESVIIKSLRGGTVHCEVVSSKTELCLLSPLGPIIGISVGEYARFEKQLPKVNLLRSPFGKVLNGYGDCWFHGYSESDIEIEREVYPTQIPLRDKDSVSDIFRTCCPLFDKLLPIGRGQKLGIFSGSGVGKSTLLNNLNNNINCDIKIFLMIGERSREAVDFYNKYIVDEANDHLILIVSVTEDTPSMKRRAIYTALAYAKFYAEQGKNVLLTIDSITRLAHSLRELAISRGELPVAKGYPPSVFSEISKIVEQCGAFRNGGSITSVMAVLVDGDDFNDPVSDFMRGILDGHIILDRKVSNFGLYPAINILQSRSRIISDLFNEDRLSYERLVRSVYSKYEELYDFINTGMYIKGSNVDIDKTIENKILFDEELFCWNNH